MIELDEIAATIDLDGLVAHPAASLFPMLIGEEMDELAHDIRKNGLQQPITLDPEQRILDGRNRLAACRMIQLVADYDDADIHPDARPRFVTYDGDPVAFVISANLQRRHLTTGQRASIAARLADMRRGERTDLLSNDKKSIADVASLMGVSQSSVSRAREVHRAGAPELVEAVERGEVPVSTASKLVREVPEPEKQRELISSGNVVEYLNKRQEKLERQSEQRRALDTPPTAEDQRRNDAAVAKQTILQIANSSFLWPNTVRRFADLWPELDVPNGNDLLNQLETVRENLGAFLEKVKSDGDVQSVD